MSCRCGTPVWREEWCGEQVRAQSPINPAHSQSSCRGWSGGGFPPPGYYRRPAAAAPPLARGPVRGTGQSTLPNQPCPLPILMQGVVRRRFPPRVNYQCPAAAGLLPPTPIPTRNRRGPLSINDFSGCMVSLPYGQLYHRSPLTFPRWTGTSSASLPT